MSSLQGTALEKLYTIFGVTEDAGLCTRMANIGLIYTVAVGLYSVFQPAPYGRYARSSFGPAINARLGWIIQEGMSFVGPAAVIMLTPGAQLRNVGNVIVISSFMLHYFHRSFIYPFAMAESRPTPILTVLSAQMFTSYNGILQGVHLANVLKVEESWNLWLGMALFIAGMAINVTHDRMLISLRSQPRSEDEGESGQRYKIPRGGLFEYVSGANYLGEIIEWSSLALMTTGYPQGVFAAFTATFLGIRAYHHHQFYKETFGARYPEARKAIVPFIL